MTEIEEHIDPAALADRDNKDPTSEQPVSADEENLKRYVHLVWRIHKRRRPEPIDRKSPTR